jgi:hypothetical protein
VGTEVTTRTGDATGDVVLPLFDMGPPFSDVARKMRGFHAAYTQVVKERNAGKPVSAWQAKLLRSAAKAYGQARRVDLILRKAGEPGTFATTERADGGVKATTQRGLTHEQYAMYLDRSIRFEEACDRALRALGLDTEHVEDIWAAYHATLAHDAPIADNDEAPVEPPIDAHGANVDDANGQDASDRGATDACDSERH